MSEEREVERISEPAYEIAVGSLQMQCKRLFILCIIIFVALIGTNAGWIIYESQFEDVVMTQTATAEGDSDIVQNGVGSGEVTYNGGESNADNQSP